MTDNISIQYARVAAVIEGRAVLRFAGEEVNSPKEYRCVRSYLPQVGDRVILVNDVIIGGVLHR